MVNKLILVFIFATLTFGISQHQILKIFYVYIELKPGGAYKQYGLKDQNGKIIVKPQYDSINQFDLTYQRKNIRVKKNEKMGLINISGEVILDPKYQSICHFNDGIARIEQNDLWGYIDTTGFCLIKPKYKTISDFVKKKALVRTIDSQLFYIDLNGNLLDKFMEFPVPDENLKLDFPKSEYEETVESYFNRVFMDSSASEYPFSNCTDGEGSYWESYRNLKFNIVYKSEGGWEWNIKRYRIPNISIEEAISILKKLTMNTDYKMSKQGKVIYFTSVEEQMIHYEIEEILPQIIEIRINSSS